MPDELTSAFKPFADGDRLENVPSTVAEAIWSDGSATLTAFYTGSTQNTNSGKYYYDVHKENDQTKEVQFAVTYGHYAGSGSEAGNASGKTNPTKAIYSQLKQVLLPQQSTKFNFHGDSGANFYSDDVFAIVVNRARYREKMDPGNWELHLKMSGSLGVTGSNVVKLIDDTIAEEVTLEDGKFRFPIFSDATDTNITITDSSVFPVQLISAEFEGLVKPRSKRIG